MSPLPPAPTLALANGVAMPQLGLGTWPMDDAEASHAVRAAIQQGYRLIDTAEAYGNETGVGEAMRSAGVARPDLFLTTKFNREWHSIDGARAACEASLRRLGTDYIDLLLIHWPNPDQDRYVEAFDGITRLVDAGLVRAAGVSNFKPAHLQRLFDAGMVPQLNQIQLDPYRRRDDIVSIDRDRGIATESWSPLGRGDSLMEDAILRRMAREHERSVAQIVLRWHIQSGYVTTPKSSDPARQRANLAIFDFALSDAEMAVLNALGRPQADIVDADSFGH